MANVLDAEVVFTTSDTVTQVLAVEKHTDARELLQRALESFGLEVRVVASGLCGTLWRLLS